MSYSLQDALKEMPHENSGRPFTTMPVKKMRIDGSFVDSAMIAISSPSVKHLRVSHQLRSFEIEGAAPPSETRVEGKSFVHNETMSDVLQ